MDIHVFIKCISTHLDKRRESGSLWSKARLVFRKKGIVIKKLIHLFEDGSLHCFTKNGQYRNSAIVSHFCLSFDL